MAEKIKKKNVKDNKLILSYTNPTKRTIEYSVIHSNSAVRSKCKAVLVFTKSPPIPIKKKISSRFRSPKNKTKYRISLTVQPYFKVHLVLKIPLERREASRKRY